MNFIEEYLKCESDSVYFIENYLGIKLFPYQKGIIWNMQKYPRVLVNACRQCGKTTLILCFAVWDMIFNKKSVLILSLRPESQKVFTGKIVELLKKLNIVPKIEKPGYIECDYGLVGYSRKRSQLGESYGTYFRKNYI